MEEAEQQVIFSQEFELRLDRLFHLQDHLGLTVNFLRVRYDAHPHIDVVLIRVAGPNPGVRLQQHFMPVLHKLGRSGWNQRNSTFFRFYLGWNAYTHRDLLRSVSEQLRHLAIIISGNTRVRALRKRGLEAFERQIAICYGRGHEPGRSECMHLLTHLVSVLLSILTAQIFLY